MSMDYEPFDQEKTLGPLPWGNDAVEAWEAAHGHDVRVKCLVEYGCRVIEPTLEREIELLRSIILDLEIQTIHPKMNGRHQGRVRAGFRSFSPEQWGAIYRAGEWE